MRILFIFRHHAFLRNFNDVLTSLKNRGHEVSIAFMLEPVDNKKSFEQFKILTSNINTIDLPQQSRFHYLASKSVRRLANYFRYHTNLFNGKHELIKRVDYQIPLLLRLIFIPLTINQSVSSYIAKILWNIYSKLPCDRNIFSALQSSAPDLIGITPAVDDSMEIEYIRAARALNIPNAILVGSWDNLSNKYKIGITPDHLIVWNEAMLKEAAIFHEIKKDRVLCLGAPIFDYLFKKDLLLQDRSLFLESIGMPSNKEYLLYAASSPFISNTEISYFKKLLNSIETLTLQRGIEINILVRPHPANSKLWESFDANRGIVIIWPKNGEYTIDTASRQRYYNSIFHAKAIIGINTSTFIESLILERPIFTISTPEVQAVQRGTHHFQHLLDAGLDASSDFESFAKKIQLLFENKYKSIPNYQGFVQRFIRPINPKMNASDVIADKLIEIGKIKSISDTRDQ